MKMTFTGESKHTRGKRDLYKDGYIHKCNIISAKQAQIATGVSMKFSSMVFVRNLTEMFRLRVIQIELLTTDKGFPYYISAWRFTT